MDPKVTCDHYASHTWKNIWRYLNKFPYKVWTILHLLYPLLQRHFILLINLLPLLPLLWHWSPSIHHGGIHPPHPINTEGHRQHEDKIMLLYICHLLKLFFHSCIYLCFYRQKIVLLLLICHILLTKITVVPSVSYSSVYSLLFENVLQNVRKLFLIPHF